MSNEIDSKRKFWRVAAIIIAFGLVSLFIFQFVLAKESPAIVLAQETLATKNDEGVELEEGVYPPPLSTPNPAKKDCEGEIIDIFRNQLTLIPTEDVAQRKMVEGKVQAWETMIAICETVTPPTVNPNETPQFPLWTPHPIETGIFEGQPGTYYRPSEAKIENHWKGIVNGEPIIVMAGAWISDPDQGFITVIDRYMSGRNYFPSPTKSGALRIVDAQGSRLVIQQANNDRTVLFFDVPALSYVGSLEATVVSVTPTAIPNTIQLTTTPYP
ncbi:MAG: hypothetical protein JXA78_17435 [Anaerolineales bacterium]|nr:hypothetical protein [Anaerolineales bacterium]